MANSKQEDPLGLMWDNFMVVLEGLKTAIET